MKSFLKDKLYIIFLVLFLLSIFPFILKIYEKQEAYSAGNELFKPGLKHLNSIEKITNYVDRLYGTKQSSFFDTSLYAKTASQVIKERFRHGTLDYTFAENWLANLSGKLFWSHMSSIVLPEDILKHEQGLCSQQTMVLMEILRRKGITVRSVGLGYKEGPGHFLCEVQYDGNWHLYDVSVEPVWSKLSNQHASLQYYLSKKDSLYMAYESKLPRDRFFKLLEKSNYGDVNKIPAKNMTMFHRITFFTIYSLPVFFLAMCIRSYWQRSLIKSSSKSIASSRADQEEQSMVAY